MADMRFNFQQKMQQQLRLTPQMMQSIELIQLPIEDLCERVYQEAEKNPAIEITKDADFSSTSIKVKSKSSLNSKASDDFQSFLENTAIHEESLQEHFLVQLSLLTISNEQKILADRLVQNLNGHGFHNEDPKKLLLATEESILLEEVLDIIHNLEPIGCGFDNIQQSLVFQSKLDSSFPKLALVLLENHFELLGKKRLPLIKKHLEQEGIFCDLEELETAINAIKKLNPNPASQFSISDNSLGYVVPEIIVKKRESEIDEETEFEIDFLRGAIPEIVVSPVYLEVLNQKNTDSSFAKKAVFEAEQFMSSLEYRTKAVHKVIKEIVIRQVHFFRNGPGNLVPLKQKDLAEYLEINEGTVSRIVNGKYLQCEWGIFELKYFFSNAVTSQILETESEQDTIVHSKESIKHKILHLIQENESHSTKKLSDSKLCDLLAEEGIKIARRTVAKYRNELNLQSSFDRL